MPHNYYIQTLLRSGALGLVVFLATFYLVLTRLFRGFMSHQGVMMPVVPIYVITLCLLLYFIPYGADPLQGLYVGFAISYLVSFRAGEESSLAGDLGTDAASPRRQQPA